MVIVPIYNYVNPLHMHNIYIYIFLIKSEQETGNGHCSYLLSCESTVYAYYIHYIVLCEATLYAYFIHIYFLKQVYTGNCQCSLSSSSITWSHFIYILDKYIFFGTSLKRKLAIILSASTIMWSDIICILYIHIYFLKQVWTENWQWSLPLFTIMWSHFICILDTRICFEKSLNCNFQG